MKTLITHIAESIKPIFKGNLKQSSCKAVDLGLSVKWCSCNVGATKPEDPGLLFQWGRTDGYKYDDNNNKFLSEDDYVTTGTKYKTCETLKPEDDAAYVNMKGDWRMPTKEEIDELLELKHEWTELNGVNGYKFTGENGNNIFIPVAGYFDGNCGLFSISESYGGLWSSYVYSNSAGRAYSIYFDSNSCDAGSSYYYYGFSVRGVCK